MQKILITASGYIANKLEERLRHRYDVEIEEVNPHCKVCEIKANIRRRWITICRFAEDENLKDILTMFEVSYELKKR